MSVEVVLVLSCVGKGDTDVINEMGVDILEVLLKLGPQLMIRGHDDDCATAYILYIHKRVIMMTRSPESTARVSPMRAITRPKCS